MPIPAGPPPSDPSADAAFDLVTLAEAHEALGSADPAKDAKLARFITAVSAIIDDLCGPGLYRTVSETHDGGRASIILHEWPVASVTSVSEWSAGAETVLTAETLAASTSSAFAADVRVGRVTRRASWTDGVFRAGSGNVVVVYVAGRFPSTFTVSRQFKNAVLAVLTRMWKRETSSWSSQTGTEDETASLGFFNAVKNVVDEMLPLERRPPAVG